jgi:hypothetical protein
MRPSPGYDAAKLDPRFQKIHYPIRKVEVERYLDGGSVGISITDASGEKILSVISAGDNGAGIHREVHVDALNEKAPEAKRAAHPGDNINFLIQIMEQSAVPSDDRAVALLELRGYARDHLRAWFLYSTH